MVELGQVAVAPLETVSASSTSLAASSGRRKRDRQCRQALPGEQERHVARALVA
jgi:hypothetical protein